MVGVFSFLIALSISLIVTRIAALALMLTGLSREAARFQARSAFSGVGFTTKEAETIVNHPVRRRIVMVLMLLGNIGIATVIATVMISVSDASNSTGQDRAVLLAVLTTGIILLFGLFSSRWVERRMNKVIAWTLQRVTDLEVRDYQSLLQLADGYSVSEMLIERNHWLEGGVLRELRLADEGILILGIFRTGEGFRGIPSATDAIQAGDTLIIYGRMENIRKLDRRKPGKAGDQEHEQQVRLREREQSEEQDLTSV